MGGIRCFAVVLPLFLLSVSCMAQEPCPAPTCPPDCWYGEETVKDVSGCDVCKCLKRPRCPRQDCSKTTSCPNGYKRDADGCVISTCECHVGNCEPLTCKPEQSCIGFTKDFYGVGCPTCECLNADRRSSTACKKLPCFKTTVCESGRRQMHRGCPACPCEPVPTCPSVDCPACVHGHKHVNGCKSCECHPPPPPDCAAITCERSDCQYGFDIDSQGCPMCTCKVIPMGPHPSGISLFSAEGRLVADTIGTRGSRRSRRGRGTTTG